MGDGNGTMAKREENEGSKKVYPWLVGTSHMSPIYFLFLRQKMYSISPNGSSKRLGERNLGLQARILAIHKVGSVSIHMVKVQDLAVHHHLPGVDGQIGVVEGPVKDLGSDWLILGVVVGLQIGVVQGIASSDTLLGVKHKHALQQIQC